MLLFKVHHLHWQGRVMARASASEIISPPCSATLLYTLIEHFVYGMRSLPLEFDMTLILIA